MAEGSCKTKREDAVHLFLSNNEMQHMTCELLSCLKYRAVSSDMSLKYSIYLLTRVIRGTACEFSVMGALVLGKKKDSFKKDSFGVQSSFVRNSY